MDELNQSLHVHLSMPNVQLQNWIGDTMISLYFV